MLMKLIEQLAQNPSRSWQFFLLGLAVFWLGLAVLWWLESQNQLLNWGLLLVVASGFICAIWGYLGIFASRFSWLKYRRDEYKRLFSDKE